ncbi:type II toxin-antitoxin system HicA family toxin [Candidatus Poriferisodalis sp.]|uniref:type II toxin-antitoxin system HicA family toxin n=1 Tax=Candidatus Poriferisodalis sp. TaxID=3101277 RepID=UPI003B5220B2
MRLPRDVRGRDLQGALTTLGYQVTRRRGSHVRITTQVNGEHHELIPDHNPIKIKTLSSILKSVAAHHDLTVDEPMEMLDI